MVEPRHRAIGGTECATSGKTVFHGDLSPTQSNGDGVPIPETIITFALEPPEARRRRLFASPSEPLIGRAASRLEARGRNRRKILLLGAEQAIFRVPEPGWMYPCSSR
jgi:hypothetical protein